MEKVRLIEENLSFEQLALDENFGPSEKTIKCMEEYNEMNENKKELMMLRKL
jgi:hypothetical protein